MGARAADRLAAFPLAELEQRASASVVYGVSSARGCGLAHADEGKSSDASSQSEGYCEKVGTWPRLFEAGSERLALTWITARKSHWPPKPSRRVSARAGGA